MPHTPGPWTVMREEYFDGVPLVKRWVRGPQLSNAPEGEEAERAEADASLIAAAPDLLDALEELLSADPDMPSYGSTLDKAEAAIRKAKGA